MHICIYNQYDWLTHPPSLSMFLSMFGSVFVNSSCSSCYWCQSPTFLFRPPSLRPQGYNQKKRICVQGSWEVMSFICCSSSHQDASHLPYPFSNPETSPYSISNHTRTKKFIQTVYWYSCTKPFVEEYCMDRYECTFIFSRLGLRCGLEHNTPQKENIFKWNSIWVNLINILFECVARSNKTMFYIFCSSNIN